MSELALPEDIRKEFDVDDQGRAFSSQRGIARLLNIDEKAIRYHVQRIRAEQNKAKSLRSLTAQDFKVRNKFPEKVLEAFAKYYTYEAGDSCTEEAERIDSLIGELGSRVLIRQIVGWQNPKLTSWQKARVSGKDARRTLTDAIKDYIERHPELSENKIRFMYSNATDAMYRKTHGMRAYKLVQAIGCNKKNLRDSLTEDELRTIHSVEDIATRLIDKQDIAPAQALTESVERALAEGLFSEAYKLEGK